MEIAPACQETQSNPIDPILLPVLQRRLRLICEEMGYSLLRTCRSPILNQARDFVTGLFDHRGRMLEQCDYIPVLAFALQPVCAHLVDYFGDDLHEGDVIIHNDVYTGGNQMADVAIFKPIFVDGEQVAWAACKGHQADIGGALAGSYNPQAREVWQEALRIPPVKLYDAGRLRRDVWDLIFANIRFEIVQHDITAAIGGCTVGEREVIKLVRRYGLAAFRAHAEELFAWTERMMRAEIGRIPDGSYIGESFMNDDGVTEGSRYRIVVTVTVRGEEITFDYTGTDAQAPAFTNCSYGSAAAATLLTFLMHVNPDLPRNAGMLRPIRISIPEGTFLNARYPAATTFGNQIADPHSEAILRALAQAIPERVTAAWNRLLAPRLTGRDPRTGKVYHDVLFLALKGGSGATHGVDGYDHIGTIGCAGGILAQDYEMLELQDPLFLLKHEYLPDSAGAGEWRGGLGVETVVRLEGDETTIVVHGDGMREGAFGLFGGTAGAPNKLEVTSPDGGTRRPRCKDLLERLPRGTILHQRQGGGGGYGDPRRRPAELVLQEARNGVISVRQAREQYGVVIDPASWSVDVQATAALRGAG
ncbi:MAG: hydantoinase B/oxoprolinase family protein [Candidatus Tectomicrobia bacterium]|nr:hydantoinase B/oxoprolinase family protein [Candidatus Tectomicrobia bacterium]